MLVLADLGLLPSLEQGLPILQNSLAATGFRDASRGTRGPGRP